MTFLFFSPFFFFPIFILHCGRFWSGNWDVSVHELSVFNWLQFCCQCSHCSAAQEPREQKALAVLRAGQQKDNPVFLVCWSFCCKWKISSCSWRLACRDTRSNSSQYYILVVIFQFLKAKSSRQVKLVPLLFVTFKQCPFDFVYFVL